MSPPSTWEATSIPELVRPRELRLVGIDELRALLNTAADSARDLRAHGNRELADRLALAVDRLLETVE